MEIVIRIVIIMRYPCLMEDEGRHEFISGPMTEKEAREWIALQEKEYFKPSDYYIVKANDHRQS